jgi:cell division protein FtsI/penicillin-binding protein 2
MTASVAPDVSEGAPQAINEPHIAASDNVQKRETWRFWILVSFFGALAILVLVPLFVHQVLQFGQALPTGAAHQGQPMRGTIVDRHGAVLAADRYFYQVTTTPNHFTSDADRIAVARRLEELAGIPSSETYDLLTRYADNLYLELAPKISLEAGERIHAEQARLIEDRGLDPLLQINLTATPNRYYPESTLASHIVGMLALERDGSWLTGYYGLEGYYDNFLRQRDGIGLTTRPNATIADLPADSRRFLPSVAGKDLVLTIDRTIQWIAQDELQKGLQKYRAQAGTIIVMDPRTGAILALANAPTFDPNDVSKADMAAIQNSAISAQYEPGSVLKVVTAAAALDTGVVTPTERLTDTGSIVVGNRIILNSSRAAWGQVDMTEALARSLNVITSQWALLLGKERFYDYLNRFGFGRTTGVDLSGEVYGLLKTPGSPDWSMSDLGTNSFGQGMAVTPIQMINSVASIANDGKLMRPYVVAARVADGKVQYTEPTVIGITVQPQTARALTEILVDVVDEGNIAAGVAGYDIAGKSGTAQIPTEEGYTEDETIVTFVGYAPADDPQFVVLVKLDRPDPNISPWANYTAAPVFAQVARRLFDYFNIPPDDIRLAEAGSSPAAASGPQP